MNRPVQLGTRLCLHCLGHFRLQDFAGNELTPRSRKARALLAYLAVTERSSTRERLADLLWSDRGSEQARSSFRQAVFELRHLANEEAAVTAPQPDEVALNSELVTTDLTAIRRAAEADEYEQLEALLGASDGGLLTDLDGLDPEYDAWLRMERAHEPSRSLAVALNAAERCLATQGAQAAKALIIEIQRLDPSSEGAARLAMRIAHRQGDRGSLHRHFEVLRERLGADFDAEPSRETQQLFSELGGNAIAQSGTKSDPRDADATVASARPPAPDEAPAGEERSTAFLSRRRAMVGALAAGGLGASALIWAGWKPRREVPPEAKRLYLRGIENRGQASLQQSEQSVAYLREATQLDPEFAEAWGALAWGYRGLLEYGPRPDAGRIANLARSAANRALELDPNVADAQAALLLLTPFYGHWGEIEAGCRRLLVEHPRHSILQYNLAYTLCAVGRLREAIPMLTAVAEQQPFWPLVRCQLFQTLMAIGRMEEAEEVLEYSLKRWPRRGDFWLAKHLSLITSGRNDEALAFAGDLSKRPIGIDRSVGLALATADALANGSAAEKTSAVSKIVAYGIEEPFYFGCAVTSCAILGATDTAFKLLEGYFFGRGPLADARPERRQTEFLFMVWAAPLRRDKRFPGLLREIGLEQYWSISKSSPDFRRQTELP